MSNEVNLNRIQAEMHRLMEILEIETAHLKANRPGELSATYEEKLELLHFLEEQKKLLRNHRFSEDEKNSVSAADLRTFARELDNTIERHGRQLIKAREVNKFLMEAIATALQDHFKEVGVYNGKGVDGQYIPKGESAVPPMKVNHTY